MPSFFRRGQVAWLFCFIPIHRMMAQDALYAPPAEPATPAAVRERQAQDPMQVFAPTTAAATPFQWGQVSLHPHFLYRFSYGSGIQSSPGNQHNTIVQQVSPGMLFNLGSHWTVDYTPTFNFYSEGGFDNTVDHHVQLGWGTTYENWFLNGSQGVAITSDPNTETGSQTDRQNYSTALGASHQLNDFWSLDLGLNQALDYVSGNNGSANLQQNLGNSRSWSTMDWMNYQFWPRLNAGLGLGGGYTQQDNSPDSVNEQYQARVNWRATDKISFAVGGGLHVQQYLSGGASDLMTPIFNGSIQYQMFDQTRWSVSASRTVSPSSFQSQSTENTGVTLGLNQRLLGKLNLNLSGGYANTKYVASTTGQNTDRSDDTYSFNARLACPFLKRGSFAVFYHYAENSSAQNGFATGTSAFGYTTSQVGCEIGWRY
jgi:hypothetical protein